jgi:hypothetical protein
MEERPIVFTITQVDNGNIRIYTKDGRVNECNREVITEINLMLQLMTFITGTLNNQGYAVLFEVD